MAGHTQCFHTVRANGFTSVNCSTMTCCHATEIPTMLMSFYCLSQTSVHCLNGKETLFGVSTTSNDSGMHLSSVTGLLDLVFSFQKQDNLMSCISIPDLESSYILQKKATPSDLGLPSPADPLSSREHLQKKVSGEFTVAISDIKANSHQGLTSGSSTQIQLELQTFHCRLQDCLSFPQALGS